MGAFGGGYAGLKLRVAVGGWYRGACRRVYPFEGDVAGECHGGHSCGKIREMALVGDCGVDKVADILAGGERQFVAGLDRDCSQAVRAAQGEVGLPSPGPVDEGGRGGYPVELYCHIGIGGRGEGEFVYGLALFSVDLSVEVVVGTTVLLERVLGRYRDLAVVFRCDRGSFEVDLRGTGHHVPIVFHAVGQRCGCPDEGVLLAGREVEGYAVFQFPRDRALYCGTPVGGEGELGPCSGKTGQYLIGGHDGGDDPGLGRPSYRLYQLALFPLGGEGEIAGGAFRHGRYRIPAGVFPALERDVGTGVCRRGEGELVRYYGILGGAALREGAAIRVVGDRVADKLGLGGNRRRLGGHREATLCGVALVVRCQGLRGRSVAIVGDGAFHQPVAFPRGEEEVHLGPVVDGLAGGYGGERAGGIHDHYVQRCALGGLPDGEEVWEDRVGRLRLRARLRGLRHRRLRQQGERSG